MEQLTHIKKLANPNFLGSYELQIDENKFMELVVTIEKVLKEFVQNGDKKEEAVVVYVKDHKPFIANSTNRKNLISSLGTPFVEKWVGRQITLHVLKIRAFGESVDALRVRKEPYVAPLPDLPLNSKTHLATVKAIEEGKTSLEEGTKFLQSKYSLSAEIIKSLEDAVKS